jgi:glycosyltransferase involved in cell wall biosynthesis
MASVPSVVRTVHNVFPFHGWLWLRRYIGRRILRILGVKNISISGSVKRTELERYSNPTELIPNWFEDAKYIPPTEAQRASCRSALGIDDDTFVSISVGGCWEYKNHPAILRALKQIENSRDLLYFHVGMEDAKRSEFLLAQELGLDGIVRFTGIIPDILPYLHAADVFLMPSLWEGFGCAAIEAMGCGLPTVLSDVPGLSDFKATCPEIRWVDCTPDSIANMLLELRRMNLEERRELGDKLAQSARSFFGTSNGAMRYGDLYRSGVSEKL